MTKLFYVLCALSNSPQILLGLSVKIYAPSVNTANSIHSNTRKARSKSRCFSDFWAAQCSPQISNPAEIILLQSLLAFTSCFIFSIFKRSHEDGDASKSSISESCPSALHIRRFRDPTSLKRQKVGHMPACSAILSGSNTRHHMISITLIYLLHLYMKSQPSIKLSSSAVSNTGKLFQNDSFYAQCLFFSVSKI